MKSSLESCWVYSSVLKSASHGTQSDSEIPELTHIRRKITASAELSAQITKASVSARLISQDYQQQFQPSILAEAHLDPSWMSSPGIVSAIQKYPRACSKSTDVKSCQCWALNPAQAWYLEIELAENEVPARNT